MRRADRAVPLRRGFTLIELLIALTVGATVILAARQLVVQLGDTAQATVRAAARIDADANAERVLRALAARLEIGPAAVASLEGDDRQVRFSSWCDVPGGWQERCAVTLSVTADAASDSAGTLLVAQSTGEPLVIRSAVRGGTLAYLGSARDGGQWLRAWSTGSAVPLAIGVVLDMRDRRDTLIFRIGGRD
jgi:prepilin-type N-terminal cleavage/methylation domain-containing protein